MISLGSFKIVYTVSCLALGLMIIGPTLTVVLHMPKGEAFSELWVLGPGHTAEDYPFNVKANEVYRVYLGIGNHRRGLQYYVVGVKFRNQTELSPNTMTGTPSPTPVLHSYHVFLQDGNRWEVPLIFSFSNVTFSENQSSIGSLILNGVPLSVNKSASWDSAGNGYLYQLFMELWVYNTQSRTMQFHNRFVGIWLNITETI